MDRLTELARRLLRKGGRTIIGITGPPGAGKSTIAAAIVGAVGADARPEGCTGYLRHAGVHGIATETPRRHRGRRLCATIRARDRGSHSRAVAIERHVPLVVTEGNYLLVDDGAWAEVRHLLDACWYVDLPEKIRQRRLTARHDRAMDGPRARRWAGRWEATKSTPRWWRRPGIGPTCSSPRERTD